MSIPLFSTKQRILGAAEELFARHGFAGASLRQVTAAAQFNLAAVNYHFGSKENLINEVFRRRLDGLNAQRMTALTAARARPGYALEDTLDAFVKLLRHKVDGSGLRHLIHTVRGVGYTIRGEA